MTPQRKVAREYVPEKARRLLRTTERIKELQFGLDSLGEDLRLDIINGWTTGDKLLDFALVACNSTQDISVPCIQYRRLVDLGLRKPGQRILVVQKAECYYDDIPVIMRNIYLATLRPEEVDTDINSLSISLPVEPGYFVWREFLQDNVLVSVYKIVNEKWLVLGPLRNRYCDYRDTKKEGSGLFTVPENGVFDIELLPTADKLELFQEHGIDADMLDNLHNTWIRVKSTA